MAKKIYALFLFGLAVALSACSPAVANELPAGGQLDSSQARVTDTKEMDTATPTFAFEPTPIYGTPAPPTPYVVEDYSDLEMNIASGAEAADFSAPLYDGTTFRLSDHRGEYVLVFPTVVGCADCVFGINVITFVNQDFPVSGLDILIMDLYAFDSPLVWTDFATQLGQPNISWGVVASDTFVIDYEIDTLGTLLLINPEGKIVFRSDHPITYFQLEALYGLIEDEI